MPNSQIYATIPLPYRLFFLTIEPLSALLGAYFAHFKPHLYLRLTHLPSSPISPAFIPTSTLISLSQLANLYLLFALNEALVLRAASSNLSVWRTLLFGLLIADLGHLYSVAPLGGGVYWRAWEWNVMAWGNVGFVYAGAATRVCFLLGVGMRGGGASLAQKRQSRKKR
jgi:hypothetical protein